MLRNNTFFSLRLILLMFLVLLTAQVSVSAKELYIPDDLKQWQEWVSYGNEHYACPALYNDARAFRCVWPELLDLDVNATGGSFRQQVTVIADSWFTLPGDTVNWPLSVTVNKKEMPVLHRNGKPSVRLPEGKYSITGKFLWNKIPQSFPVPDTTGLVSLRLNNSIVPEPFIDKTGRLWIQKKDGQGTEKDQKDDNIINISIFRLIENSTPLQINSLIRLTVSGEKRREKLLPCLPANTLPVSVISSLPVKLLKDGSMWIDVKPGKWDIRILSIINTPVQALGPVITPYGDELWAIRDYPELRITRIEGIMAVDPTQSTMPDSWKRYSTYLVKNNDRITFTEIQRGRPDTISDTLNLRREIWLDFNGSGATIRDTISGKSGQRSFFSINSKDYTLGRISVSGKDVLVTQLDSTTPGVELERGQIDLTAVSRLNQDISGESVTLGWDKHFQKARCQLNLPPGWRLLGVKGGSAPYKSTWADSWSMLDFFLILVVSIAVAKLWRWWWGLIFLVGMTIIAHESWAPFYIWLILIITTAVYKFTKNPASFDKGSLWIKAINSAHYTALIILCGISLIFAATQIRNAIYPQLEQISTGWGDADRFETLGKMEPSPSESRKEVKMRMALEEEIMATQNKKSNLMARKAFKQKAMPYKAPQQHIATQTGPGIPAWEWNTIPVNFGLVPRSHPVTFYLASPLVNSTASIVRVIFLMVMIFRFVNINVSKHLSKRAMVSLVPLLVVPCIAVTLCGFPSAAHADIPPPELLTELEQRLTAPHDCFPNCASVTTANVTLPEAHPVKGEKQFTEITLTVNAAVNTIIPIPSGGNTWKLYDMTIDGLPHRAVRRENGTVWTPVSKGVHKVTIRGIAYGEKRFRYLFPLKPSHITMDAEGWKITGLDENNQTDSILQAIRETGNNTGNPDIENESSWKHSKNNVADFMRVKRTLTLGLEWHVITRIERFVKSEDQQNSVISVPLLKNELIRTDVKGLNVNDGIASVTMPPETDRLEWRSSIPVSSSINLHVPENAEWTESWELNLDSMWHMESKGIPVTYPANRTGSFWYPWPGEQLELNLTRLDAAPGESITIDSVKADYYIGKGFNRVVLKTKIRTTSGRTHTITSPPNAIIKTIKLNGRDFPLSGNPEKISLPLQPGTQTIEIEWNESEPWEGSWFKGFFKPKKLTVPVIDLGKETNNIDISLHLPEKLWVLVTHGPVLGPAVLAWSMISIIILAAVLLGRLPLSPLTTGKWIILGLGLITLNIPEILCVVCWFMAMELRKKSSPVSPALFNLMQIVLSVWTLVVVITLFRAVSNGLLHLPDMQIDGNGSYATLLNWTLDHSSSRLPTPWVLTYSVYIYHILMLFWASWLALNCVSWAKLAVTAMKSDGLWRPVFTKKGKRKIVKQNLTR